MQVTELSAEGLKRQYRVVVPAGEIETRIRTRLERIQKTVRLPGFRPGKAPLPLLQKQYGRSVMGEVLEEAVDEGAKKAVDDHRLRPALRPRIEIETFDEGADLAFKLGVEVLPDVPEVDLAGVALTRLVAEPSEDKVREAVGNLARARQSFAPPPEPRPSRDGDRLTIDFAGAIDGQPFEGGSGEDFNVVLGSGSMVPGFEEGLVGLERDAEKDVTVTFPEAYANREVASKEAVFRVTVKDIQEPQPVTVDDEWAKGLGLEGLADLEAKLRERFAEEYRTVGRARMKRSLLDQFAERYPFEVPPGMVDLEFEGIWKQLTEEMKRTGETFGAGQREGEGEGEGGASEDETRAEYRAIAERRVRLGLLLADIGNRNGVKVENEELQRAIFREASRFPGQERQVLDYFRNNTAAVEGVRAPLYEDKVCEFVFGQARVVETQLSAEDLLRDADEPAPTPA